MLEWIKNRDEDTCEVFHTLWNPNLSKPVVWIRKVDNLYEVQILDHTPFHAKRLNIAMSSSKHIYEQTGITNG